MRDLAYLAAFVAVFAGLVGGVYLCFVAFAMNSRRATEHRARLDADLLRQRQRYQKVTPQRTLGHYGAACADPDCGCPNQVRERGYAPSTSEVGRG